jgi:nitronate monooxygenase
MMPPTWEHRLAIPAIVAPMFLISGPALVTACCRAGLVGTFPALNQRTTEGFVDWLEEIEAALDADSAPYGVNLIVHRSNMRLMDDLAAIVRHRVPLVITSLGLVPEVIDAVHGYGGLVFHDVISTRHAQKAVAAGVDGLIAVAAGAGGHAGTLSPFALVAEIRRFFDGPLALAGAMSEGRHVAAARMMGADLGYLGSLFIAAEESLASAEQKAMMVGSSAADVVHTPAVTGVAANFLRPSLEANGWQPGETPTLDLAEEARAWKTIWSAGHGVGGVDAIRPAAAICTDLIAGYARAWERKA